MCFSFRTAQIKYIAVELIYGWCFLRNAIQISSSVSHYHPSKGKKKAREVKLKHLQPGVIPMYTEDGWWF